VTDETPADDAAPDRDGATALPWQAAALCIVLAALWGGTPTSVRIAGDAVPPIFGGAIRFGLASLFMLVWCLARGERLIPTPAERRPCGVLGVFLFAQIALYHTGVAMTNASHAALFISTFIFWVAIVEHLTGSDRLSGLRWVGMGCAAAGIGAVFFSAEARTTGEGTPPTLRGDLIVAVSGLLLGVKTLFAKRQTKRVSPGTLILWHDIVGAGLLLAFSLATETVDLSLMTTDAALALLYQGLIVGGLCYGAQTALLEHYSASRITAFNAATPVWGVGIAIVLLGDPMSPWLFVAAAGVAIGIVLINRRGGRTKGGEPTRDASDRRASVDGN